MNKTQIINGIFDILGKNGLTEIKNCSKSCLSILLDRIQNLEHDNDDGTE